MRRIGNTAARLRLIMVISSGLAISFAGALVLLAGSLLKGDEQLKVELQLYASGFNRELTRALLAERYDHRFGALLLALGFFLQLLTVTPLDSVSPASHAALAAMAVLLASLAAWWIPRKAFVRRDLKRLTALITRDWK